MNKIEALTLIGVQESDNWQDELDNKVFEIKQFILKSYHTPQVCWARSNKLIKLYEAESFLLGKPFDESETLNDHILAFEIGTHLTVDLIKAYRNFESILSQLKLSFLQEASIKESAIALKKMGDLEHNKLSSLAHLAFLLNVTDTQFKISTFVNSGEIIRELMNFENQALTEVVIQQMPNFSTELAKSLNYINFTKK